MVMACGNRDIRDMISACTVWFTFISRTPIPRAVEDFVVKVLRDSHGSCFLASALLPSLYPYYSTLLELCQEVFLTFLSCPSNFPSNLSDVIAPTSLYPYYSMFLELCQEGIFLLADFFYSVYLVTHHGVPCGDFPLDNYSIAFRD